MADREGSTALADRGAQHSGNRDADLDRGALPVGGGGAGVDDAAGRGVAVLGGSGADHGVRAPPTLPPRHPPRRPCRPASPALARTLRCGCA